MDNIETAKKVLTGIFKKNQEMMEPDDSIFIPLIKRGIEEASRNDKEIYDELLEYTVKIYTDTWLKYASEDEEEFDPDHESKKAKRTFMEYFEAG